MQVFHTMLLLLQKIRQDMEKLYQISNSLQSTVSFRQTVCKARQLIKQCQLKINVSGRFLHVYAGDVDKFVRVWGMGTGMLLSKYVKYLDVLYLHVVEERSVASFPGSSQTHRNGMEWKKIATADCYNAMGPCDVDKPQNLTLGN